MELRLQLSGHHVALQGDIEATIRGEAAKLERFYPRIIGCRVLVEVENRFASGEPVSYTVHIDLTVPQGELPTTKQNDAVLWTAVQEAFAAMRRRLEDFARIQRGDVGASEAPDSRAHVLRLFPWEGYGFLEAADGHEVYFHRNSVLHDAFDRLEVGSEVRFVEEEGDKGPQASTVVLTSEGHGARQEQV